MEDFGLNESVHFFKKLAVSGKTKRRCMIAGFTRSVNEVCALLGFYAAQNGSLLPTFRDNLSVSSARIKAA